MNWNRRDVFKRLGLAAAGATLAGSAAMPKAANAQDYGVKKEKSKGELPLVEFKPKSMLHVPETKVPKSRFPVIDVHTHLAWSSRDGRGNVKLLMPTDQILKVMDAKNIRTMIHL